MKLYLPNSVWIGNIDPFLRAFQTSDEETLEIVFHQKWVSVHPLVLSMVAAVSLKMTSKGKKIEVLKPTATSKHYFERMGLFKIMKQNLGIKIEELNTASNEICHALLKSFVADTGRMGEFRTAECKDIIDKIDDILSNFYGLTKTELKFIKSYDSHIRPNTKEKQIEETTHTNQKLFKLVLRYRLMFAGFFLGVVG